MPLPLPKRRHTLLSQQELCAISERIGRDHAPRFSRHGLADGQSAHFSSRELQDISRQISQDFAPTRQSDQSQVVLMAVSPRRLHVYWQIAKQKLREVPQSEHTPVVSLEPAALTLRIYGDIHPEPLAEAKGHEISVLTAGDTGVETAVSCHHSASPWIEVAVEAWQGQQDIQLPEALLIGVPGTEPIRYNAVLGQSGPANGFKPLAYSNITASAMPSRSPEDGLMAPSIEQFIMSHSAPSSFSASVSSGQNK